MTLDWITRLDGETAGRVSSPRDDPREFARAMALYAHALDEGEPQAVVQASGTADVRAAVQAAAREGMPLSVRGGGHSGARFAAAAGGLMLDLSTLRQVRVDPDSRTATVAPGATWGDYDAAAQVHGLASTGGVVSSTGVAGLTLGGGIGALRGLHGLSVDNLRGADVVLADGSVTRADADHEQDLFWGLRGGGGNFGVVVSFEFDVHPVAGLTTGLVSWPLDDAHALVAAYRSRADDLADHTVAEWMFGHDPHAGPVVMLVPRVVGAAQTAVPLLDALLSVGSPITNTVGPRTYCDGQRFMDEMPGWGHRIYWSTTTLRHLDERVVGVLADFTRAAPSPLTAITVEHLHGEISRRATADTAVGFRHAPYNVFIEARWDDPAGDADNKRWARALVDALSPFSAGGAYVNYLPRDAGAEQVREAYGTGGYERLRRIKTEYDPANLFRSNQNIPPLGGQDTS